VSSTHLGQLRVCWCGYPLWREDGYVVYRCCWASLAQSLSDLSPAGLMIIFHWLNFETPPTWRSRFPYLFPRVEVEGKLWQTVSRPVYLGVEFSSGAHDQVISFSLWYLLVSWCGTPSPTKDGSVIYSYNCFWALPEQSLSGLIWDTPNLEGQIPVFISAGNRVAPQVQSYKEVFLSFHWLYFP
jgi:hypothetical protein